MAPALRASGEGAPTLRQVLSTGHRASIPSGRITGPPKTTACPPPRHRPSGRGIAGRGGRERAGRSVRPAVVGQVSPKSCLGPSRRRVGSAPAGSYTRVMRCAVGDCARRSQLCPGHRLRVRRGQRGSIVVSVPTSTQAAATRDHQDTTGGVSSTRAARPVTTLRLFTLPLSLSVR